ncbi:hypothetical protein GUJ93_ZPchr0003g17993 [Zizania palustris]|uniref:VAN3-binding protein-like auxin canalisation domain-containing protein n=1 Tax=Zizania palustris TaxID=103762 RepID=A0A8J5VWY8_ZIZPA|nr:hypothetical protein GUJ93_ZPchr0003g17993 [Zizania palustris]
MLSCSPTLLSPLTDSLFALLPLFLASSSSMVALTCEVLGAAALQSMEASEMLASDACIANGLARALGSGSQQVADGACNAIMDLRVSSVGMEHLAGSAILPSILYLFSRVESVSGVTDSRSTEYSKSDYKANKARFVKK